MTLRTGALAVAVAIVATGVLLPAVVGHVLAQAAEGSPPSAGQWVLTALAPIAFVAGGSLTRARGQGWLLGAAAGGLVAAWLVGPAAGVAAAGEWLAQARSGVLADDAFRVELANVLVMVVERTTLAVWACLLVGAFLGGVGALGKEPGSPQQPTAGEAAAAIGVTVTAAVGAAGTYFALEMVGGSVREILGRGALHLTWWPLGTSLIALVIAGSVPVLLLVVFAVGRGPWWIVGLPVAGAAAIGVFPPGTPADDDAGGVLRGMGDALTGTLAAVLTLAASLGVAGLVLAMAVVPATEAVRGAAPPWSVAQSHAIAVRVLVVSGQAWTLLGFAAFLPGALSNAGWAWLRARRGQRP